MCYSWIPFSLLYTRHIVPVNWWINLCFRVCKIVCRCACASAHAKACADLCQCVCVRARTCIFECPANCLLYCALLLTSTLLPKYPFVGPYIRKRAIHMQKSAIYPQKGPICFECGWRSWSPCECVGMNVWGLCDDMCVYPWWAH